MKIPFDECVPWPLAMHLTGHECQSVQRCGWNGIKNGELLALAESNFDLFLTADQSLSYQQNLSDRRIAILQLDTNKLHPLEAAAEQIGAAVAAMKPGEFRMLAVLRMK